MTQVQDVSGSMTAMEKRATVSLAGIYSLRMLGLFMLLPVLSLFTEQMPGSTPKLVGLTMGIYGLTQAILQIPFGLLSDKFNRKTVIIIGLLLFLLGSVVAALAGDIYGILIGRALQGCGAVSAAVMALVADLTQEVNRTKAMATIGASIGVSFGVAMTLGPVVAHHFGIAGIFWLIAFLAILAILVVLFVVPNPEKISVHRDAEYIPSELSSVIANADLLRLNYGIFALHLILMASFVVVPLMMRDAGLDSARHWLVYLPVLVTSMAAMIPFIVVAEKKRRMKPVFIGAIASLVIANLGYVLFGRDLAGLIACLWVFFCGFNLLEATLPSLISKTAPGDLKGTAMGIYSSAQFIGAFLGGACGGWLYGEYGPTSVFVFSAAVAASWVAVAYFMSPPRYLVNLLLSLKEVEPERGSEFSRRLLAINGIEEVRLHFEENTAYLKIDSQVLNKNELNVFLKQWH
ncbi:MFS transporter [Methylomonas rhizoryzae]|uniref:MFS transporter n=1 Tax=Methylomonas rhizoryzae TaxID=2608981 RepID=UPI001E64037C|nr:MFS transporter [Methylomonas rhizoryzae]